MLTSPRKPGVIWMNRGFMPSYFGFCPSEEDWRFEMKKFDLEDQPYPSTSGNVLRIPAIKGKRGFAQIVTLNVSDETLLEECIGLLVHEAFHVWVGMMDNVNESYPTASEESGAYTMQAIAQQLIVAFLDTIWIPKHGLVLREPEQLNLHFDPYAEAA